MLRIAAPILQDALNHRAEPQQRGISGELPGSALCLTCDSHAYFKLDLTWRVVLLLGKGKWSVLSLQRKLAGAEPKAYIVTPGRLPEHTLLAQICLHTAQIPLHDTDTPLKLGQGFFLTPYARRHNFTPNYWSASYDLWRHLHEDRHLQGNFLVRCYSSVTSLGDLHGLFRRGGTESQVLAVQLNRAVSGFRGISLPKNLMIFWLIKLQMTMPICHMR